MLELFFFVFKIAMVAYFLFLCSLFIRKYRDYFMWFRVHKLYKRYKKIGFKNNPWGEFIEYVKQKYSQDKCINAEQITSRKKVIGMLSTYGTIIESYCQQNRFFPKEYDEMMVEINSIEAVKETLSNEEIVIEVAPLYYEAAVEEVLLNNDVASENIFATTDDKEDTIGCKKSKRIGTKPVDQVQMKTPTLIDLLRVDNEHKEEVLSNIKELVSNPENKGKANGSLIRALEDLHYIDKDSCVAGFIKNINLYFGLKLECNRGVYHYSSGGRKMKKEDYKSLLSKLKIKDVQLCSIA